MIQLESPLTALTPNNPQTPLSACGADRAVVDVSVVIVNWNTRHVIGECLASLSAELAELSAEVIVVDNASTDKSVAFIEQRFPEARIIANAENRGFAAANNQGMRVATGRYVLLLNPDTVVMAGAITESIKYAEARADIGVLGCQVLESPTIVQRTCFRFPSPINTLLWLSGALHWFPRSSVGGRAAYGPWDRRDARDVDVVSGMFMLVRREALEQVGLMDEQFFVFAEEADWCRRFWAEGWRCVFAPVGRILHVDGGSKSTEQASVKMYVEIQKGLLRFQKKHLGTGAWAVSRMLFGSIMILRMVWWSLWGAFGVSAAATNKARQAAAAVRYHLTGVEPGW